MGLDRPHTGDVESDENLLAALDWRPVISDAEIVEAKLEWLTERDSATPSAERVSASFEYYRALISLQAQQIADEFRTSSDRA